MKNSLVLRTGSLELRFIRERDRWAHEIAWLPTEGGDVIWQSREGSDDDWPPSPPFQDLHVEQASDTQQIAFLVGSTSAAHWSASVEADAAADRFKFDIACRLKQEAKGLGSSYERNELCEERWPELQIFLEPIPLEREGECRVRRNSTNINVTVDPGDGPLPRTVRWSYLVYAGLSAQVEATRTGA